MSIRQRAPGMDRRRFLRNVSLITLAGAGGLALRDLSLPPAVEAAAQAFFINATEPPYNAPNDGVNDATNKIQSALTAAGNAKGGVVLLPAGYYKLNGSLTIPTGVTLQGVYSPGVFSSHPGWNTTSVPGTTLLAYSGHNSPSFESDQALVTLYPASTLQGLGIFYPNQSTTGIVPYPWTIRASYPNDDYYPRENVAVLDCLMVNPYQAVDFSRFPNRHFIRGLYGQPLRTGIRVDKCQDVGRIEDVHFWPFWTTATGVMTYTATNGVALDMRRSDWQIIHNFFAIAYNKGIMFTQGTNDDNTPGTGTNGQFSNINLDQCGTMGLDIESVSIVGAFFSNFNCVVGNPYNPTSTRVAIWGHQYTAGHQGHLSIVNGGFWPLTTFSPNVVTWDGGGTLSLDSCLFRGWASGQSAVSVTGGRAIIKGNQFQDNIGKSVNVGQWAQKVLVADNLLNGNPVNAPYSNNLVADNML